MCKFRVYNVRIYHMYVLQMITTARLVNTLITLHSYFCVCVCLCVCVVRIFEFILSAAFKCCKQYC